MIVELCLDFKNQIGINLESRAENPIPNRQIRSENRIGDRRCSGVLTVERRNPDGAFVFHISHEMNDSRREHKHVALPKAPGEETVLRHAAIRSIFCGQSKGQTRRTLPLLSTSALGKKPKKEVQRCNSASGHTCWNVLREAKIDPPIQTLYFLSGGATTLIFILLGANAVISLLILSAMPVNIVVPPLRTIFPYSSFHPDYGWLEENLWAAESLSTNSDHLSIGLWAVGRCYGGDADSVEFHFQCNLIIDDDDDDRLWSTKKKSSGRMFGSSPSSHPWQWLKVTRGYFSISVCAFVFPGGDVVGRIVDRNIQREYWERNMVKLFHEALKLRQTAQETAAGVCAAPNLVFSFDLFSQASRELEPSSELHFLGRRRRNYAASRLRDYLPRSFLAAALLLRWLSGEPLHQLPEVLHVRLDDLRGENVNYPDLGRLHQFGYCVGIFV
nr:dynein heavy chain 11, axonemal [Ipomoea batatas]